MAEAQSDHSVGHATFCSSDSEQVGEALWGTAARVDVWLLLEYAGPWGRKAFAESDLPGSIKKRLMEWLDAIPHSRLQLIKRQASDTGPALFVALSRESDPVLIELSLDAYADVLDLDIPALISGSSVDETLLRRDPLFLVCTNGRRDRCCARHGFPIYQAMQRQAEPDVWQTSHLGGHRFAATALFLPHGAMYGRITADDITPLIAAQRAGHAYLPAFRGRSCYDPFVQAADHILRTESGIVELDHFRLQDARALEAEQWRVTFSTPDGAAHTLVVGRQQTDTQRLESCAAQQPGPVSHYHLIDYHVSPANLTSREPDTAGTQNNLFY